MKEKSLILFTLLSQAAAGVVWTLAAVELGIRPFAGVETARRLTASGWMAAAVLMGASIAAEARGDEPVRHVVRANESCSSIAKRYYGDTRFVDLLHAANPEITRVPPPHVLREGMVLVIPPKRTRSTARRSISRAGASASREPVFGPCSCRVR
jgi:nucleoid-associated protein YgaU